MTFGCVVLTMGRRPEDLRRALDSLLAQRGVELDVVVVGNEWEPTGLPDGVRGVGSPRTSASRPGATSASRTRAASCCSSSTTTRALAAPDALAAVARRFEADPQLGLLQLRVAPRDGGASARDWVPRLRVGDRSRSSDVTAVWEGAVAMRRSVFEAVGGWPADFRFVHEGIDLGWRVMDAGHRVAYAGDIVALHPSPTGTPHGYSFYYGARNRVWLARRHLPLPLAVAYVVNFALRTLPRLRSRADAREALRGYRDGLRGPGGERKPLSASTLWRMTRAGRPPIM